MGTHPTTVLFAEMPEAEGRDLAIERAHLPAGAQIRRFVYRGDPSALIEAARDAEAILTDYVPFDLRVLGALGRCRILSVAGTGYDCVDVPAAAARGIAVSCVGEYCTDEVADHALALLLALNRRLLDFHQQVQQQHDWRWNTLSGLRRLRGQTLGLIGFGRIGQAVCRRALGFGLEVIAADPLVDAATAGRHGARLTTIDEVFAAADIISLHCNVDAANRGLLDRTAFARMQRRPLLINVARGALVVEPDLVEALDRGQLAGAALDVLVEDSPDLAQHPLAGRADVLLTPHVAFLSEAALADLRRISAGNIRAFLEGRPQEVFRLLTPAPQPPR